MVCCCVLTRFDAESSLRDGRSHVLTYQAGGSAERYRVKVARTHHNAAKRAQGLLKMQVRRTNEKVMLWLVFESFVAMPGSNFFGGWAQGGKTLTGARLAIKTRTSDDGCC